MQDPKQQRNSADQESNQQQKSEQEEERLVFNLSVKKEELLTHLLYSYLGPKTPNWETVNSFKSKFDEGFDIGLMHLIEHFSVAQEFLVRLADVIRVLNEYKEYRNENR